MPVKTFKYRLRPTKQQEEQLAKHFGSCCFIWNYFLAQRKDYYLNNEQTIRAKKVKGLTYYDNAKKLTELKKQDTYAWLNKTNSQSLQATLKDLDNAYARFFKKQAQFPRFKKKYDKQAFRVPQHVRIKNSRIYFPKFKQGIKVNLHRNLEGKIQNVTISRNQIGQYFVSISCQVKINPFPKNKNTVGLDLGIKNFAVCSDGKIYDNQKILNKYESKLRYKQKQLSKKNKGSKNRDKARIEVAKVHNKIGNTRQDFLHKTSTHILKNHGTVCIEDLNVKGMMANHRLAKSVGDASWAEFVRQLEYKADWYGRKLVKIDKFFPSSATCYWCKHVNQELALKHRKWICPNCKKELDRDYNASLNILKQGLHKLNGGRDYRQKPVELPSVDGAVKQEAQLSLAVE
ncbi:transposase [Patescibacteria group bacterium AH-259-L07]|nr:transposase [Patescibacteria group bacterium AH-259-L07]